MALSFPASSFLDFDVLAVETWCGIVVVVVVDEEDVLVNVEVDNELVWL